jgi:hypothetical protein
MHGFSLMPVCPNPSIAVFSEWTLEAGQHEWDLNAQSEEHATQMAAKDKTISLLQLQGGSDTEQTNDLEGVLKVMRMGKDLTKNLEANGCTVSLIAAKKLLGGLHISARIVSFNERIPTLTAQQIEQLTYGTVKELPHNKVTLLCSLILYS